MKPIILSGLLRKSLQPLFHSFLSIALPRLLFSHSVMSDSATPWTVAHQAPLSMGILQARILEWVAMPFSRGSSQPRDGTPVSLIAGGFFIV